MEVLLMSGVKWKQVIHYAALENFPVNSCCYFLYLLLYV